MYSIYLCFYKSKCILSLLLQVKRAVHQSIDVYIYDEKIYVYIYFLKCKHKFSHHKCKHIKLAAHRKGHCFELAVYSLVKKSWPIRRQLDSKQFPFLWVLKILRTNPFLLSLHHLNSDIDMMWLFSKAKFSYYFQKSRPYFAYSVFRPGNTERIYPHNNNGDVVDVKGK